MQAKGTDPSGWNWQMYDRSNGILPTEEEKAMSEFELPEEIQRVDEAMQGEKRVKE